MGGHDHWEDLRLYQDADGNNYHNLFVSTGIGMDHNQLPGFSSMKFNEETLLPKELIETSLDITKAYGMDAAPPLESLPVLSIDFTKDYGMADYSPESISSQMQKFEKGDFSVVLDYLSDKLGYDHKSSSQFSKGLNLASSWSLIDKQHTRADAFFCQAT